MSWIPSISTCDRALRFGPDLFGTLLTLALSGCEDYPCPDLTDPALGAYAVTSWRHDSDPLIDATFTIDRQQAVLHYFREDGSEWEIVFDVYDP